VGYELCKKCYALRGAELRLAKQGWYEFIPLASGMISVPTWVIGDAQPLSGPENMAVLAEALGIDLEL
jgi:hypothetical protein